MAGLPNCRLRIREKSPLARRSASTLQGLSYLKLTLGVFLNNPNCLITRILEFIRAWRLIVVSAMREIVDQDALDLEALFASQITDVV